MVGEEDHFQFHLTHLHSLDETLIVGDGTAAFALRGRARRGRISSCSSDVLCRRGWGAVRGAQDSGVPSRESRELPGFPAHVQQPTRALPRTKRATRFTPDGKAVLYNSGLTACSNMYLVEVGEFDELPDLE